MIKDTQLKPLMIKVSIEKTDGCHCGWSESSYAGGNCCSKKDMLLYSFEAFNELGALKLESIRNQRNQLEKEYASINIQSTSRSYLKNVIRDGTIYRLRIEILRSDKSKLESYLLNEQIPL